MIENHGRNYNYDLKMINNIISSRTSSIDLANKVCLDTFNYYCKILLEDILQIYIYLNLKALNLLSIDINYTCDINFEKGKNMIRQHFTTIEQHKYYQNAKLIIHS